MEQSQVDVVNPTLRKALVQIAEDSRWEVSTCAKHDADCRFLIIPGMYGDVGGNYTAWCTCETISIPEAVEILEAGPPPRPRKPKPIASLTSSLGDFFPVILQPNGSVQVGCMNVSKAKIELIYRRAMGELSATYQDMLIKFIKAVADCNAKNSGYYFAEEYDLLDTWIKANTHCEDCDPTLMDGFQAVAKELIQKFNL